MRNLEFPSISVCNLLVNDLSSPVLDLYIGLVRAICILRSHFLDENPRHDNTFLALVLEHTLCLHQKTVEYTQDESAKSSESTQSVLDSNTFSINLEAWIHAYPQRRNQAKYATLTYQHTYELLTRFAAAKPPADIQTVPRKNYILSCISVLQGLQKKIEYLCPKIWKKLQLVESGHKIHAASKYRPTQENLLHVVNIASVFITRGLNIHKHSSWTPTRSFKTLSRVLQEHGPMICGPLTQKREETKESNQPKNATHRKTESKIEECVPHYLILVQTQSCTPPKNKPPCHTTNQDCPSKIDYVHLLDPKQNNTIYRLPYQDFCQNLSSLPCYRAQKKLFRLHLDIPEAEAYESDDNDHTVPWSTTSKI